jgi:hypothetical protein
MVGRVDHINQIGSVKSGPTVPGPESQVQAGCIAVAEKYLMVLLEGRKREMMQKSAASKSTPDTDDGCNGGVHNGPNQVLHPLNISSGQIALSSEDVLAWGHPVTQFYKNAARARIFLDLKRAGRSD